MKYGKLSTGVNAHHLWYS